MKTFQLHQATEPVEGRFLLAAIAFASTSLLAGCVFPFGERGEVEIDPFEPARQERRVEYYRSKGMDEESARQQAYEDRFFESMERDSVGARVQRQKEQRRQREFEDRFRDSMRR